MALQATTKVVQDNHENTKHTIAISVTMEFQCIVWLRALMKISSAEFSLPGYFKNKECPCSPNEDKMVLL